MGQVLMFLGPARGYPPIYTSVTGRFPQSRSEWIVVWWRLRFAAGVCLVAAGLLMGGGTVALADPGLGGSAPSGDDGTHDSVQGGPTAGGPVGNVTDTVRQTIQGVTGTPGSTAHPGQQPSTGPTSTLGSGRQPGQQPSTGATTPKTQAGGTDTADQKEDAGLVPAHPNPVAAVPNVVAPVTKAVVAPVTDVLPPVTDVVTPVTDALPPVTDVVTPVTDVLAPVTNEVAPITDLVAPVVAPVTNVLTPVSDVIAPGQYMPTSVAGALVPLTQPPSNLSSFLSGIAGVAPVQDGSGGIHRPGLAAAAGASGASPVPLGLPFADVSGVPVAGNATRVATLDVILLGRVSALSGMAPQAPNGAFAMGAESLFPHIFDELLLIASLSAVAAVALPGVGGLVILTVVGVRIGYGRPDSHREHRALRDSPIPRAVKRWMSAR
jgi:hypothetical protein